MSYKDDIRKLEYELNNLQLKQSRLERDCKHPWGNVKYDPEEYIKYSFSHYIPHGSDPEPVYNNYLAKKDRWSRECPLCGKIEYTYEQVPTKYEPKF